MNNKGWNVRLRLRYLWLLTALIFSMAVPGTTALAQRHRGPSDLHRNPAPKRITIDVGALYSAYPIPATVWIYREADQSFITWYDPATNLYSADIPGEGIISVVVASAGYEPQWRAIETRRLPQTLKFVLGKPGSEYIWINGSRIPFFPRPDEIGVYAYEGWDDPPDNTTNRSGDSGGVRIDRRPVGRFTLQRSSEKWTRRRGGKGGSYEEDLALVRAMPGVMEAGPIYQQHEDGPSIITNELIVSFWEDVREGEAHALLRSHGLTKAQALPGSPRSYVVEADPTLTDPREVLESLMRHTIVRGVTPSIILPLRVD